MRSTHEIAFRLRQELANVALWRRPPRLSESVLASMASPLPGLPDPAPVASLAKGSAYAGRQLAGSQQIVNGELPLLGITYPWRAPFAWRKDHLSGRETPLRYFRRIPYLDPALVGDHKIIWEPSRLQYLAHLAQAIHFDERPEFLPALCQHLESWLAENPFQEGINWTSALEVAFRALSLIWVFHFAGDRLPATLRQNLLHSLYQHGWHLEYNLSIHFSPNTHLLGEAVALHALGVLFPQWPPAARWRQLADRIVQAEATRQVHPDGGYFEQSTYYHVYALDMFLFHAVLSGDASQTLRGVIQRMAEWLHAMVDDEGRLPFLGDDDGGRFFAPDGQHDRYALGTLATAGALLGNNRWLRAEDDLWPSAAWWLGPKVFGRPRPALEPQVSRLFPESGLAVFRSNQAAAIMDAGPFGPGSGGHSHSDTLSLVLTSAGECILIDPGTYTYLSDPAARNQMRGSAAHNTVRLGGRDQAEPAGPFRWSGKPRVKIGAWQSDASRDFLDATCCYAGFTHRRRVLFRKPGVWFIVDDISGPPGTPVPVEQCWHPGEPIRAHSSNVFGIGHTARLTLSHPAELETGGEAGWIAPALGRRHAVPMLRVRLEVALPCTLLAVIELTPYPAVAEAPALAGDGTTVTWAEQRYHLG